MPGRVVRVGGLEHHVPRSGIIVPMLIRIQIHRTELPLAQRIVNACQEAPFLFVLPDLQPEFNENDARISDVFFDFGTNAEKALSLFLADETHHLLDTCAIVPAAIENDDFATGGKALDVALQKHLGLFPIGGRRQCGHSKNPRAYSFGYRLDRPALPGSIPPFKYDNDPGPCRFYPILQIAELHLQLLQFLLVLLAFHLAVVRDGLRFGHGG